MPIPALAAAGIAMISSKKEQAAGMVTNYLNRRNEKKDYDKQRGHNLQDWHMQNAYNHPQAQMQRLKQAGLNPALIYGGSSGQASGSASSSPSNTPMRNSQIQSPQYTEGANLLPSLSAHYDFEQKQATTDLTRKQTAVAEQDAIYRAVQTLNVGAQTEKTREEIANLRKYSGDLLAQDLAQKKANVAATLTDTQRKEALHPGNMEQQVKALLQKDVQLNLTKEQVAKLNIDKQIAELERKLLKAGLNKNDPAYAKFIIQNTEEIKQAILRAKKSANSWWESLTK